MVLEDENKIIQKKIGREVVKNAPAVSVIIPAYNVAKFIEETLSTVFAQTFCDFEIILVNDGSPDTEDLEQRLDPFFQKIVYIKQKNGGVASARNTAINYARGVFLAFLDGDDLWLSEYLESQINYIKQSNYQMVYCNALMFNEKYWSKKTYMESSPSKGEVTTKSLILGNCNVITSGTVVKKEKIVGQQGFDENPSIAGFEDFDLWFRLAKQGCRIGYQKKVLLKYRVTNTGLSGGNVKRAERSVRAMNYIKEKNKLTESELSAWSYQLKSSLAELEIEKGKYHLVKKDFVKAIYHLTEANSFYHKRKLLWLIRFLKLTPDLVFNAYKNLRSDEFNFVSSSIQIKD